MCRCMPLNHLFRNIAWDISQSILNSTSFLLTCFEINEIKISNNFIIQKKLYLLNFVFLLNAFRQTTDIFKSEIS